MKKISLAYMLGGLSSRFGGRAKAFAKVGPDGENLLEYSLNQALKNDFDKIIFIVNKKVEKQFRDYFGDEYKGVPIEYALQTFDAEKRDKPWGTNDAICCALNFVEGPFIVCNGDDIYGEKTFAILYNYLLNDEDDATIGYNLGGVLSDNVKVNRGIFECDGDFVKSIIENIGIERTTLAERNLTEDSLCSMNIFGLQKSTLELLKEKLERFKEENKNDSKVECLLPKEINNLISEGKIKMRIFKTDALWFGVTSPEDEEIVRGLLKEI